MKNFKKKPIVASLELHHFFILTSPAAPAADQLVSTGLIEGPSNNHPGQGTANRRFFFSNLALELLYVRDATEANRGPARLLRLPERVADPLASPFGLVLKQVSEKGSPPFPGWKYYPEYLPDDESFHIGDNSRNDREPLCICMPNDLATPNTQLQQTNPELRVTNVQIDVPVSKLSLPLEIVSKCDGVSIETNKPHQLVLTLNGGRSGRQWGFSPDLPLVICT